MGADIDKSSVERAYARWARSTISFSALYSMLADAPRSKRPSRHVGRPAGASLKSGWVPAFRFQSMRAKTGWLGIDLSEPMLRRAHERVAEYRLTNVETLAVMDAERHGIAGSVL